MSPLAIVFAFATLNESIIEYLVGSVKEVRPYLPLIALATAIFLCFTYQINIFSSLLGLDSGNPFLDFLLSGFIISRGSNFVNDFVQKFLGSK
ncbi:MAG: Uncharacterized protein G01um10147_705 [Microgenomates group bacterium Gr01-1014_7]|nr:MAG: Uncharacterized protein G01um10147_705 [Microgenomates group bacterium Gr01-1014_7]